MISKPSFSIAAASARMPMPEAFSERKSSSMMTIGNWKRSMLVPGPSTRERESAQCRARPYTRGASVVQGQRRQRLTGNRRAREEHDGDSGFDVLVGGRG